MENAPSLRLSVSDFIALTNQTLEYAYPSIEVEGEVASFKVNQGKFVFFDLKDDTGSIGCFMMLWQLRSQIEDGMKVVVVASPKLTAWGKFSLTVRAVRPSGEGSLKKSFELLRQKLEKEGLFSDERKRSLPVLPGRIGVISSMQAAGYTDFMTILNDRWGGLDILVAQVQVQGVTAPDQILRALRYLNSQAESLEVIVIVRGGGSADDLSAFNDELLVREIALSRVPTLVGVGHEVDVSLTDMAADVRAATPSHAAHLLVPDRSQVLRTVHGQVRSIVPKLERSIDDYRGEVRRAIDQSLHAIDRQHTAQQERAQALQRVLYELDPRRVLERGYAIMRGDAVVGGMIEVERKEAIVQAEITHVKKR